MSDYTQESVRWSPTVSMPTYGFADDPHLCDRCEQSIHLRPLVSLGRLHFHVGCWNDRVAAEARVYEGEAR